MEAPKASLSAAQLRAARGLLDWTRSDLAKACGLSAETIKNIERGVYMPQETTIGAIVAAFSEHNVEFTTDDGVRKIGYQVKILRGRSGYREFLDHIFDVVKDNGGVIRQFNLSDGNNLFHAEDYANFHLDRMSKIKNLDARVLVQKGDLNFPATYCQYRWFDESNKIFMPFYVYNDFVEFTIHKDVDNVELVIIHSPQLASAYMKQFDIFWESSVSPKKVAGG